jgi:acetyl esterase/lipase
LLDDAVRLVDRAREAGVEVAFKRWPVVPHGWQLLQRIVPEAAESVAEAAEFLQHHMRRAVRPEADGLRGQALADVG